MIANEIEKLDLLSQWFELEKQNIKKKPVVLGLFAINYW